MTEAGLVRRAAGSSLDALFDARARTHPDRIALEHGPSTVTYRALQHRSRALATVLAGHGVAHGSAWEDVDLDGGGDSARRGGYRLGAVDDRQR